MMPARLPAAADVSVGVRPVVVIAGCVPLVVMFPRLLPVAVVVLAVRAIRVRWRQRAGRRSAAAALAEDLPVAVALLQIAAAAGHGPRTAMGVVGAFGWGCVAESLGEAAARLGQGVPLADALTPVPPPRLVELLERADEDGGGWAASLTALADDLHRERMAAVEERTGRLTVALLVPLVVCILPALVLLAIVPVVGGALFDVTG
jgi:pilus assembly protein TadC